VRQQRPSYSLQTRPTWSTLETSAEPIIVALRGAAKAEDASSAPPNAPRAMAFMEFSLRLGETLDHVAIRDSSLASNIELFHGFPEIEVRPARRLMPRAAPRRTATPRCRAWSRRRARSYRSAPRGAPC